MEKRSIYCVLVLLASIASFSLNAAVEEPAEHAAVKHVIEQSIGWAIEKDFESMYRLWADDLFHFWLFSDSVVVGLEAMKKHSEQWRDPDFRGTRFEFRDLRIVFSRTGDVAWYSCHLDDCYSFKGKDKEPTDEEKLSEKEKEMFLRGMDDNEKEIVGYRNVRMGDSQVESARPGICERPRTAGE